MSLRSYWLVLDERKRNAGINDGDYAWNVFRATGGGLDAIAERLEMRPRARGQSDDFFRHTLVSVVRDHLRRTLAERFYPVSWIRLVGSLVALPQLINSDGETELIVDWVTRMEIELTHWIRTFENWDGMA